MAYSLTSLKKENRLTVNYIVLVESPKKIKVFQDSLSKIQGCKFFVLSTKGHINEAKPQKMTPSDTFESIKWNSKGKLDPVIKKIKELNNDCIIVIATDSDREGEGIGFHVQNEINLKTGGNFVPLRIYCKELNKESIMQEFLKSIESQTVLDRNMIDSYKSRVFVDMLIGINGSSELWSKLYGCRSMGRVQSVALLKIFDLEKEVRRFRYKLKQRLCLKLKCSEEDITIREVSYNGIKIPDEDSPECFDFHIEQIKKLKFYIESIDEKIHVCKKIGTVNLAQLCEAAGRYGLCINTVYRAAQVLYEGKDDEGFITYMRTDSNYIEPRFVEKIKLFIKQEFGEEMINSNFITSRKKDISTQEAHEAVRITNTYQDMEKMTSVMDSKEMKLYKIIFYHTIAPFMMPRKNKITTYRVISEDKKYSFVVKNTKIHEANEYSLKKALGLVLQSDNDIDFSLCINQEIIVSPETEEFSNKAPSRFSEIDLIKSLKENNIGRPSTYQYIINVIKSRQYAFLSNKRYYLSSVGHILCLFLRKYMDDIINYKFTGEMELELDRVVVGKQKIETVIEKFKNRFFSSIEEMSEKTKVEILEAIVEMIKEEYQKHCPHCNEEVNIRVFNSRPYVFCECKFSCQLNQLGYSEKSLVPQAPIISKYKSVFKKVIKRNLPEDEQDNNDQKPKIDRTKRKKVSKTITKSKKTTKPKT